jgi:hypothetical protein
VNPDTEILNAVRPGLATTSGPLILVSSPYARRGELWRAYRKHYGAEGDPMVLVAQGASREFNVTLPQSVVDRAMVRDPATARAEYGAEFRKDIEGFVSIEAVHSCIVPGCFERAPQHGVRYHAFVDPSGGSFDSFAMAIGHIDYAKQTVVVDAIREVRPPFSPEIAVVELVKVLKSYRVDTVVGDRYAGEWPREQFGKLGERYEPIAKSRSELYVDLFAADQFAPHRAARPRQDGGTARRPRAAHRPRRRREHRSSFAGPRRPRQCSRRAGADHHRVRRVRHVVCLGQRSPPGRRGPERRLEENAPAILLGEWRQHQPLGKR